MKRINVELHFTDWLIDWLIDWLVLNANLNNISAISWSEQILST
jgi:hypothetical protein